ncbi:MAG: hypothetical protein WEA10_03470 [Actinomycetota bacterium]
MSDEPREPHLPGGAPPPPSSGPIAPPPGGPPATPVPPPKQKKSALLLTAMVIGGIVAFLVIAGIVLAVVFFANAGSYEANGVSYEYPKTWTEATDLTTGAQAGGANELWSDGVIPIVDSQEGPSANVVLVTAYRLQQSVTEENVAQIEPEVKALLEQLVSQQGSGWDGTLQPTTVAARPGLIAENVGGVAPGDRQVESRVIFLFDGTTQYFINCQYLPEDKNTVLGGCDQITNTFQITG